MAKNVHEIRDPIHVFIRLSSDERRVLDSRPFQRLRHIHQLAMTYLIYPGATHRRFEHSLGVMELAGRVFDVVTRPENIQGPVRDALPEISDEYKRAYWRRALCMAALCHDLGHLPFSHGAEKELLPAGWNHERLTAAIVRSAEMQAIWDAMKLQADDVVKLALGPKEATNLTYTTWETILAEIIVAMPSASIEWTTYFEMLITPGWRMEGSTTIVSLTPCGSCHRPRRMRRMEMANLRLE